MKGWAVRLTVDGKTESFALCPGVSTNSPFSILHSTFSIPLADFRPWSPEHPNLYTGIIELVENGNVVQTRRERFGVRKIEVRGRDFYLNGKPFFIRGFGDDAAYPITGMTPPDIEKLPLFLYIAPPLFVASLPIKLPPLNVVVPALM